MASQTPLQGTELVDCARANVKEGITAAAQRCGYGDDLIAFDRELRHACEAIGVDIEGFSDLITKRQAGEMGLEIAPESPTQL